MNTIRNALATAVTFGLSFASAFADHSQHAHGQGRGHVVPEIDGPMLLQGLALVGVLAVLCKKKR